MSLRAIGSRLFNHGSAIIRSVYKREYNIYTIAEKVKPVKQVAAVPQQISARNYALKNVGWQVGLHARRLFVDSVLNRVTNSLAAELRRKAARRMLFGDSGPFFALVGVSLASGTGILTKDDELEGICLEIRDAVSKIKWQNTDCNIDETRLEREEITLKDLDLAQPIAKGCSAVVYAGRLIDPITNSTEQRQRDTNVDTVRATVEQTGTTTEIQAEIGDSLTGYPLAIKMMFNYDVQSSAMAILRAMYRETVPARRYYNPIGIAGWEHNIASRTVYLSPHPNIVSMYSVFTDRVPELPGAVGLYPAALPPRLHPDGAGRNMSLFMVMKRYDCSLQQYLSSVGGVPPPRTSLLLFAQLLEAVVHINMQGVAHRDLKTDNILLDLHEHSAPILVLTDFGCCLADKENGLHLPYNSMEIDKGGNTALMAPEVITQVPGTFSVLNYSKADLWAVGSIAYEIFGLPNPFYGTTKECRNIDYKESDLPKLPEDVPHIIKLLVTNILNRNPKKRLDPEVAANVCQLLLWAPSVWLKTDAKLPSSTELLQWLLCLTTKVLCEGRLMNACMKQVSTGSADNAAVPASIPTSPVAYIAGRGRRTYPEYLLISNFLGRAKLAYIKSALRWVHQSV